jgi:hypothetical protein
MLETINIIRERGGMVMPPVLFMKTINIIGDKGYMMNPNVVDVPSAS